MDGGNTPGGLLSTNKYPSSILPRDDSQVCFPWFLRGSPLELGPSALPTAVTHSI